MVMIFGGGNRRRARFSGGSGGSGGSEPWSGWDLTNVPAPPTLSNPVHYGGTGQAYSSGVNNINGGGGDILLENPADGQPLKNSQLLISNFRNVHIKGLHLKYDDKTISWPCADKSASRTAAQSLGSDAYADTYGGPGPTPAQKRKVIFENPAYRQRSDWPDKGPDEANSPYQWWQRAIEIDSTSSNADTVYVEGLYVEDANYVWHQGDLFALQNHGGGRYKFHMVNSRVDAMGIPGEDDEDLGVNGNWVYRTIHCDIAQVQGGEVDEFQFWNCTLFGNYQSLFLPTNQNGYVFDFYMGRTRIGTSPGEFDAPIIYLADPGNTPAPVKRWDDVWLQREWRNQNPSTEAWRLVRPYSEDWFGTIPEPPWQETLSQAEAGNKIVEYRRPDASDLPDFAPEVHVGANYVSPWA